MPKLTVTIDLTDEAARFLEFYADMAEITIDDLVSARVNESVHSQLDVWDGTPPEPIKDDDIPF